MESKKRMMTGSKMARESRGPFISDGRMASSADRESMKQNLPFISDGRRASSADRESMIQKLPVRPYDEMSTTGALSSTAAPERSYRPIARPKNLRDPRTTDLEERSLRSQQRESQDYEDFGGGHQGGPAKKFKDGGMVRGAKPGQTSGTKFSGTF
jgi:hypothetical protein